MWTLPVHMDGAHLVHLMSSNCSETTLQCTLVPAGKAEVHLIFPSSALHTLLCSSGPFNAISHNTAMRFTPAGKAEVHLIFPTAAQAASAAEGFRSPWARKALRLPEGEPPIEVRVLEIQPPKADWQQR
jgi:hypothetical protein